VICSVAVGPTRAADDRGHDDRGADRHYDNPIAANADPTSTTRPRRTTTMRRSRSTIRRPAEGINLFFGVR
jgi:hypothetical protein